MNDKTKKIANIAFRILAGLLIAFTVFMMLFTIITVTTVDKNERSVFGARFYIVQTGSMSKSEKNADLDIHFDPGDIIIAKELTNEEKLSLKRGDVISFLSVNEESYGETITHMIHEVKRDKDGKLLGYVTYGTNTGAIDEALVEPSYILGLYGGKLPGVGNFFAFVKSTPGYIVCILVPFLLLIAYNGANVIRLFRRYKKEQTAAIEAERAEIAAERQQNLDMLRELQALRDQLAAQSGGAPMAPPTDGNANNAGTDGDKA